MHLNFANYEKDYNNILIFGTINYVMLSIGYRYEIVFVLFGIEWGCFIGLNIAYARPLTQNLVMMYLVLALMTF